MEKSSQSEMKKKKQSNRCPVNKYLLKLLKYVYNEENRTTSMTYSSVFVVNFEHILHLCLVFLLLTLNIKMLAGR